MHPFEELQQQYRKSLCLHPIYIVVSEFELHSRYNVQFRTNTHTKGMNLLIPPQLWV